MLAASAKMLDCRERSLVLPGDSTAVDTVIAASGRLGNKSGNGASDDVDNSSYAAEMMPLTVTEAKQNDFCTPLWSPKDFPQ